MTRTHGSISFIYVMSACGKENPIRDIDDEDNHFLRKPFTNNNTRTVHSSCYSSLVNTTVENK